MKRLTILAIILAVFVALCLGQRRSRLSPQKVIQLTDPRLEGPVSFEEALAKYRSVRQFTSEELKFTEIGQLAWAGQGIIEPKKGLRTAPSVGATYPITLYFVTPKGMFLYNPDGHSLEEISELDLRNGLAATASTQEAATTAACQIIVVGSMKKVATKFRDKARTYMLLEAGRIAQNIQLQAVCLDLGSTTVGDFDIAGVRRVSRLPKTLEPICIICVGHPAEQASPENSGETIGTGKMERTGAKRAVLIVAREGFRDEELFDTRRALTEAAVETTVASSRTGPVRGALGGIAQAAIAVNSIVVDDYDAIIFVGGPGAREYFDSPVAWNIAREAVQKRKILAAICIAPSVLANAGVLRGVRATSFITERDRLTQAGAIYTGVPVERDRYIITASGPLAAVRFGQAIADALAGR